MNLVQVPNFSRVNNMLGKFVRCLLLEFNHCATSDIIPIVPGKFLGFYHPDGEIHILSTSGNAVACSGMFFNTLKISLIRYNRQ